MTLETSHFQVAIIGTGFSGLGMAIRLKQSSLHDFVVLERASEVGGTWLENTYPGCACDIPSHLYSFSFALNPDWSRVFSPQPEIWAYLQHCAERYGIMLHIRFSCPLQEAAWDNAAQHWQITTPQDRITADVLVMGYGPLSEPTLPDIPGLDKFQGTLFHSAQWNHHNLNGQRVAVIGSGASAIQFVPQIQPKVSQLVMFQRTPPWIFPRLDKTIPRWQRKLYRFLPLAQRLVRAKMYWERELRGLPLFYYKAERTKKVEQLALKYLAKQIADPTLRTKLTPNYALGCKRVLISDDFYQAVSKPNVQIETGRIKEIQPDGVLLEDGTKYAVDTLICATGFRATEAPIAHLVRGREGQSLAEEWREAAQAYLGTTVAGFPNLFLLIGPNTGLGHNSMIFMIEAQIGYILDALRTMQREKVQAIEVQAKIQTDFNLQLQHRLQGTVWNSGCKSWYLDQQGRNTTIWPGFTFRFRQKLRRFDRASYSLTPIKVLRENNVRVKT